MSAQTPTEPGNGAGLEWIENRRAALERFLCRTAQHPVLCLDGDFINFLQSNEELPRAVNTAALSGAGVMRLFNRFGETVNKITYKMDENDPVSGFLSNVTTFQNVFSRNCFISVINRLIHLINCLIFH